MKYHGVTAALMLGGNVGDTVYLFSLARKAIISGIGPVVSASEIYVSEPWGLNDQPVFRNQALLVETRLSPEELLSVTIQIEKELGRVKRMVNGPREIDIDILLYGDVIVKTENLVIPHPRLHLRKFNLVPLAEIAPQLVHPVFHKTISKLVVECTDPLDVQSEKHDAGR